jgi:hypothetical protein
MYQSQPVVVSALSVATPVRLPLDVWHNYWPVMLGAIGLMIVILLVRGNGKGRTTTPANPAQGWRVGHEGRDMMFYEEKHGGRWRRIPIPGEMLTGRAHHVIYFASIRFPDWAEGRREEILARI